MEIEKLKKQTAELLQKLAAKTDTIVRLGQDLEKSENDRKITETRMKTFERNLERTERELELITCKEASQRTQYLNEKQDLMDDLNRYKREVQTLRAAQQDLQEEKAELRKDCKTFRQTIARYDVEKMTGPSTVRSSTSEDAGPSTDIGKYEKLQTKITQVESDLKTVLGLNEELVLERDELQRKVQRLTTELSYMLSGDTRRVAEDLDSLIGENRYLKAQLNTAQEESESIKSTLAKYRSVAESMQSQTLQSASPKSKSDKESTLEEKTSVAVINMKQIRELLASQSVELDDNDFRSITVILLDLCNDKQMAIAHLRRANKVLGARLQEFEAKLAKLETKSRSPSPRHDIELSVPNFKN